MNVVPKNRLIRAVATIAGAAALTAAIAPALTLLALCLTLVLAVVAVADAIHSARALHGIAVQTPELIRTVRNRSADLPFSLINSGTKVRELKAAVELPESFVTATPVAEGGRLLNTAQKFNLATPFESNRRGEFHLTRCDLATTSRLGLWSATAPAPINLTIRVYPNLRTDDAAAEFLKRTDAGSRLIRMTGKGREFEKLREYNHGDSYDDVDWKATARRGKPVVRVFQVERTQEIYVAIDASRLSARPFEGREAGQTSADSTLEQYVNAALVMGLAAEQQGDRFGLISFSDRVHQFVRARGGKQHFTVCREAIYRLQPRIVEPDFGDLFSFLRTRLTKRALVVILTALDDPLIGETFARQVSLASRRHLTIVAMVRPEGARPLFEQGLEEDLAPGVDPADIAPIYRQLAGHMAWRKLFELTKDLKRKGVRLHLLEPRKISGQLTALYLDVKRRQQL